MTTAEPIATAANEETVTVKKVVSSESEEIPITEEGAGVKRAFEEIQPRADITIHDLEAEEVATVHFIVDTFLHCFFIYEYF